MDLQVPVHRRTVNALARALGFAWLGLLAFLLAPPSAPSALPVQIACYAVLGLALLAWTVLEASPTAAASRIFAKTGSRDRAAAIGYAHRHNIG